MSAALHCCSFNTVNILPIAIETGRWYMYGIDFEIIIVNIAIKGP